MACISYKNKSSRFQDPRGAVLYAKQGSLAVESKVLPSGAADLPGCCSARQSLDIGGGFHRPSSDSKSRRCVSPYFAGNNGRQREEADPSCAELCAFSKPPAKHVWGCNRHLWQPEAGLSFKSLLLPKARVGLMLPAPSVSPVPTKVALLGG